MPMDREKDLIQDIGIIHKPKKGELVSGDDYLIQRVDDKLFLTVIDGLGHGPKAHEAATTIKSAFQDQIKKGNLNLMLMFDIAHKRAASTRGGVVAAAVVDTARKRISFLGIGNISIKLVGKNGNDSPITTDGIVGYTMERKKFHELPYEEGQVLILHSDGVSERYGTSMIKEKMDLSMQELAQKVVEGFGRNERDDVTFLAAKL